MIEIIREPGAIRALPHAVGPEKSILSTMMQEPEYIAKAGQYGIEPSDFYIPSHGTLYLVLRELVEKGRPVELISLTTHLRDKGVLDNLGGPSEVTAIYCYTPTPAHFAHHCGIVAKKSILRRSIEACTAAVCRAYEEPDDLEAFLGSMESGILGVLREKAGKIGLRNRSKPAKEILAAWHEEWSETLEGRRMSRFPTGLPELDAALGGGLIPGGLTVITGPTGGGKTALGLEIAANCSLAGKRAAFASLEMLDSQIAERLVANVGRVSMRHTATPVLSEITQGEMDRIKDAVRKLRDTSARFTDTSVCSITDICDEIDLLAADGGIDLVVVDYIQLVDGNRGKNDNREREVASISKALHRTGLKHGAVIIAMSQLNDDGKVRESRAIAQDAVTHLEVRENGIWIEKNRQGPGKHTTVPLALNGEFQRFERVFDEAPPEVRYRQNY